ncbi:LAGLIDADG family homing endonuclease [Gracilibacillus thailandensis]|uniref:LAGLIDADG family homing endonuclease n=1 Tax=Gracilibacillus thailandensis TaxID=563735 RepID=UPI001E3DA153|nr:LAGLIDADG family homing endonuclease [Gracilibacillus thailandensis]
MEVPEAAYLAGIIDGEGTITLTRMHKREHRRPCITIASTDLELLEYLQTIAGGNISNKRFLYFMYKKESRCFLYINSYFTLPSH